MEKTHLLLLLSGLFSLSGAIRYLQMVKIKKTWYKARNYCRDNCIELASIEDMEQMQTLLKEYKRFSYVWLGLQTTSSLNWHWSLAQKDSYKEGEMDNLIWGNETSGDCGAYENGKFFALNCTNELPAVCFDEKGPQQFVLISPNLTWRSAQSHCRTQHTDLVSVKNEEARQTLQEVVGDQRVWTGLFRDLWKWSDGSDSSFRYWKSDQPGDTDPEKKKCANLKSDKWESRSCKYGLEFFCTCEKNFTVKKILKVRISSKDSGLDLNDPAVKEDILRQIKEQMSLTNVTHMQWRNGTDGRVFVKEPEKNQRSDCEL